STVRSSSSLRLEKPRRRPIWWPAMSRDRAGIFSNTCAHATPLKPGKREVESGSPARASHTGIAGMKITGVRPWLIESAASYWGEFLFVEVTTDEQVSGWGEITTTT